MDLDTLKVIRCKTEWIKINGRTYRRSIDIHPDGSTEARYAVQSGRYSEGTLRDDLLHFGRDQAVIRQIEDALRVSPH